MTRSRTTLRPLALAALAWALFAGRAPADVPPEASRVRFLLIIDTLGLNADLNGFAADKDSMKKVIKETFREQNLEDRYTLDILHGADAKPARVLAYYRDLKVSPTETLVCYYSGHGGAYKEGGGHFLEMKAGRLRRSELLDAMKARGARLLVLLSDCCADYGDLFTNPRSRITLAGKGGEGKKKVVPGARQNTLRAPRGETLRHLLFHGRGVVDITACEIGKLAFSSTRRGGYFTLTLANLFRTDSDRFDADGDGLVGWGTFFTVLQDATRRQAHNESYSQTPRAFALGAPGEKR
jgi:hypothetical protein